MRFSHPVSITLRFVRQQRFFLLMLAIVLCSGSAFAQQPFVTDDTDVTPRHKFHFEFSNEFDVLPRASFPNLKQNTADAELDYGLFKNFEVGIEAPVLTIVNDRSAPFRRPTGLGDVNLSFKYNYLLEREGSWRPALAVTFNLEMPTGDVNRQLGSGLADFYVNNVLQKSLTKNTKLRLNGGLLFSGNETTGVIGLKSRGLVLTGAASLVKQFTPKLDLGVEVTGAVTRNLQLGKGQLQTMVGGNYALSKKMTFDFGIVGGRYAASPRVGVQLGISVDF
ncbi:MAG TPA: transporter [Pyrinomonadaceae bacterium]|nr:transporter [Pyrinomonadaceae bacterium]